MEQICERTTSEGLEAGTSKHGAGIGGAARRLEGGGGHIGWGPVGHVQEFGFYSEEPLESLSREMA